MTEMFKVLQVIAALFGIALFAATLFIGLTYCFKIYYQDRKKYLEEQIRIYAPGLNLEIIVKYTKLCTNMGYTKNEILEQIYHLTERELPHK